MQQVADCPMSQRHNHRTTRLSSLKIVGVDVPDDPILQRHPYRTARLHLAFLREEGGPLAVEGACVHNEILCSDNRRKLHKIYYTVRTVGNLLHGRTCPYKFVGICLQDRRRELH